MKFVGLIWSIEIVLISFSTHLNVLLEGCKQNKYGETDSNRYDYAEYWVVGEGQEIER